MLRGLTIFTGLLGVVLLGTLVVLQVQRGLDDNNATPASFEADETLEEAEVDLGEPAPLTTEDPISSLQSEPEFNAPPSTNQQLLTATPTPPPEVDDIGPAPTASPSREISAAPAAFPESRSTAPPKNAAVAPLPIDDVPSSPTIVPSSFPTPPSLDPPTRQLTPPPTANDVTRETVAKPPTIPTPPTLQTIRPAAAGASVPPKDDPAPPATTPRVIDLAEPPTLSDIPSNDPATTDTLPQENRSLPERPATVAPAAAEPAPTTNTDTDPLTGTGTVDSLAPRGLQEPQLAITKSIPATGVIGQPLIYTIRIKNTGTSSAVAVVVEDPIPAGAKLTGTVPQAELDKGLLSWTLGTMKPGEEHKIMVRVVPTRVGELGSTATVRFAGRAAAAATIAETDATPAPAPATSAAPPTARPIPTKLAEPTPNTKPSPTIKKAGLSLNVEAPAEAQVGEVLTLKFTLTNNTKLSQSGIVLRNVIPAELDHPAGTDLEYPLPPLAAGDSKTITLQVTAKAEGEAVNRATLASGQTLVASDQDTIRIASPKPITLQQTVPAQASVGASATLKTTVTNTATTVSEVMTLSQTLAPGLEFLSATDLGKFDPVNGRITWQVPSLQPGATATFSTTVRAGEVGKELTSLVRLTAGTQTLATSTKSLKTVGFAAPSLQVSGIEAPAATGRDFDITYRLSNRGTAEVTAAQLKINLPDTLTLVKITGGTRSPGNKPGPLVITPKQGTINSGQAQAIVLTVRAANPGQHLLQSQLVCDQLKQPLARTDAITTLPGGSTP